ncbi:MAG TPA: AtpZ/AtpI family protein [Saprospiraceae bacterium]|nr:AtpZ/AtpI family protein [Saprospiraceae bacterium]HRX29898.1 AtpZ/AtpI family protein [Saprospiraceae bacterium]
MKDNKESKSSGMNAYLKYSGIAFQLAGLMIAALFIGQWLDKKMEFDKPYLTATLIILFFFGYLYRLYIDLTNTKD